MIAKIIMKVLQALFKPVPEALIDGDDIKNILKESGSNRNYLSDKSYMIPRQKDIEEFLKIHIFKFRKYVPEKYDCDNYSFSLMGMFTNLMSGYAIGIVWVTKPSGTKHALNFFINKDNQMIYIEPQSNKIFADKGYKPYFIVM